MNNINNDWFGTHNNLKNLDYDGLKQKCAPRLQTMEILIQVSFSITVWLLEVSRTVLMFNVEGWMGGYDLDSFKKTARAIEKVLLQVERLFKVVLL